MSVKKICIFVHHDEQNQYSQEDIKFINHLLELFEKVVVLTGNDNKPMVEKFKRLECVNNIPNKGYDFGKIQKYIQENSLENYEEFYVFNNSCFLVRDLLPSLQYMQKKDLDFWGYTTSNEGGLHIQSYSYFLNKKCFDVYREYIIEADPHNNDMDYRDVVDNIEIKMLQYLSSKNLKCGSFLHTHKLKAVGNLNPTIRAADILLLNHNYPFIKKKIFTQLKGLYDLEYLQSLL